MDYYPIFLNLRGRLCVVVGGGAVATRKVDGLVRAGATVRVVSPALTDGLRTRADEGTIQYVARPYRTGDLDGALLACVATDDAAMQRRVRDDARATGVLLNVVDVAEACDFIAPAILESGALVVAVSTGGRGPAFAGRVRDDVARVIGSGYAEALDVYARLRGRLGEEHRDPTARRRILRALVESDFVERLSAGDTTAVNRLLGRLADCSLADLGFQGSGDH